MGDDNVKCKVTIVIEDSKEAGKIEATAMTDPDLPEAALKASPAYRVAAVLMNYVARARKGRPMPIPGLN